MDIGIVCKGRKFNVTSNKTSVVVLDKEGLVL